MGGPDFDGETWETGSRADVDEVRGVCGRHLAWARWDGRGERPQVVPGGDPAGYVFAHGQKVTGGEEGLSEVAGHDIFGAADGGEVDAGAPAN